MIYREYEDADFSRLGGGAGTSTTTEQKQLASSTLNIYRSNSIKED